MSKKMGRPTVAQAKTLKPGLSVRLSDAEMEEIANAITKSGIKKSPWIRDALLTKARMK